MRIISLVPSITETLFDLGLNADEIVGRTKFCIHPKDKVREVEIIGGTKTLNLDKIQGLKPDLVIANKEENVKEQIVQLQENFKVLVTDISNLEDNYYLLKTLGNLVGKQETAQKYNSKTNEIFDGLKNSVKKSCAYLIWNNPYMTVGSDTFISEILDKVGFENIFKKHRRYPEISIEDLRNAEYILLSSEPFPFKEKHVAELQKQLPNSKIILVDGEAFSWYGTRLAKCEDYFISLSEGLQ